MYVAGHLGVCYLLPLEIVLWRIALGTLKIIFLFNLIEVKCMYDVIPFMKGEKDVCMPLRLNREGACLGEMEMSISVEENRA